MKRSGVIFGILCILLTIPFLVHAQNNVNKIDRVVIDAGHGGEDPGALGKRSREKDIVLAIALKTGEYIEKNLPDVRVIYTRKTDRFIELYKRAQIANESHADLFISIHCNSNPKSAPYGAETYVMGLHKSEDNLEVAKLENAAILLESDYTANYEGFDPNSDEAYIVFTMYQNIFLEQSLGMAVRVQDQFRERVGRHDRGVKQAGFLVLYRTTMPGVLIETGFLSNASEESYLMSEEGQVYLASAIYRAFKDYKLEVEGNVAGQLTSSDKPPDTDKPVNVPAEEPARKSNTTPSPAPVPAKVVPKSADPQAPSGDKVFFRVQVCTSPKRISLNSKQFLDLQEVREYNHGGLYKYTSGNVSSYEEASRLCKTIRAKGFNEAFVVAFQGETRIDIQKARQLEKSTP
ncbi:MAG: N-acetylmuramoyl-L-alanine amidase [Bacteroidales bacterium]|nr:N-acetylmuramoyl-L-alanine amidase [Lentimicrobiaceae bacterium]MDD5693920.1 N-acetylmuramoyl-L-alanine amidase [Bacteroidales bacterium]